MRFDLHLHTTASDGQLDADALVAAAAREGLAAVAITDHDTTAAIAPALRAAHSTDVLVIPGVELSASHNGRDVHILGYFVDPEDPVLAERLSLLRDARLERARMMVAALREGGYEISLEHVLELAAGGSIGRSHVARALVSNGHALDVSQAFDRLIGRGRPFYRPKPVTEPSAVVRTIRQAGAVPVLAHPGITLVDDLVPSLVDAGLRGLEAFHADHTPEQREHYARWAAELGLLTTGGSDFHGPNAPGLGIGRVEMPDNVLPDLLAARADSSRRT